ncbi:hypothetical protein [Paenibacillus pinihumi]|uniref:hypothetical protein n=1 Tax=Paenibacillus pinihumi TaxID=669462 RepID=UPI0003F80082|nr:hypothetical protein [Paenibacillus pinihumi]
MKVANRLCTILILSVMLVWLAMPVDSVFADGHSQHGAVSSSGSNDTAEQVLYVGSLLLVALGSYYFIIRIRGNKEYMSVMTGMMAAMATAMAGGLVAGTVLGIMLATMMLSSVIGILIGLVIGFLAGRPLGALAVMDGILSGVMGGMMGAMLGVMVIGDHPVIMVLFMDAVYIIILIALYNMLRSDVRHALTLSSQPERTRIHD